MKLKLPLVLVATLALVACGPPKEREINNVDLEITIWKQLHEKGKMTPSVHCPSGLDARVGARIICYMTITGRDYDVTATATAVERTTVDFDIEVADEPRPLLNSRPPPADHDNLRIRFASN